MKINKMLFIMILVSANLNATIYKFQIDTESQSILVLENLDENGFNSKGINKETGTNYNQEGYDQEGLDENGFNLLGIHKDTGTNYNQEGYDKEGYNENGFNLLGVHKDTGTNYNQEGYDKEGYAVNGFNEEEKHKDTGTIFDSSGFDILGFDIDEFDASGKGEEVCLLNGDNGNQYRISMYQNSQTQYWGEAFVAFDYEGVRVTGAAITYSVGVSGTPTMSTQTKAGITGYVLFNDSKYIYTQSTHYKTVPFSGFAGHTYYGVCRTKIER